MCGPLRCKSNLPVKVSTHNPNVKKIKTGKAAGTISRRKSDILISDIRHFLCIAPNLPVKRSSKTNVKIKHLKV